MFSAGCKDYFEAREAWFKFNAFIIIFVNSNHVIKLSWCCSSYYYELFTYLCCKLRNFLFVSRNFPDFFIEKNAIVDMEENRK